MTDETPGPCDPNLDTGQLAWDIAAGKVFGTWNIPKSQLGNIGMVFLPFGLLEEEQRDDMKARGVVHIYEYLSEAGPRSINGMPIFTSFRMLTKGHLAGLLPVLEQVEKMKQGIIGDDARRRAEESKIPVPPVSSGQG